MNVIPTVQCHINGRVQLHITLITLENFSDVIGGSIHNYA